jgi:hypothetical protein
MKRIAVAVFLSLLFAFTVSADLPVTIKFEAVNARSSYNPKPEDVELVVAVALAAHLRKQLPHWRFAGTREGGNSYNLSFCVVNTVGNGVGVEMEFRQGEAVEKSWDAVWLDPSAVVLDGFPPRKDVAKTLGDDILKKLIKTHRADLMSLMEEHVPIATGGYWMPVPGRTEEPRIVLPLPWSEYSSLNNSDFRIECTWPDRGVATLEAQSEMKSAIYASGGAKYQALAVTPLQRIFRKERKNIAEVLQEVLTLVPIRVYLAAIRDPIHLDIADGGGN